MKKRKMMIERAIQPGAGVRVYLWHEATSCGVSFADKCSISVKELEERVGKIDGTGSIQ
jgi:hypothetical protein